MNYEIGDEIDLTKFEGKAFACIIVQNVDSGSSQPNEKQRILLLSRTQLMETIPIPNKQGFTKIKQAHHLEGLSSIKFSRAKYGVMILQFKSGSIFQFKVKDADTCADAIKKAMVDIGIIGKVTKSKETQKIQSSAEQLMQKIRGLEAQFSIHPTLDLIQELVDLMRETVERLDAANDERFITAIQHIQKFLSRNDVISILDKAGGTTKSPPSNATKNEQKVQVHENLGHGLPMQSADDDDWAPRRSFEIPHGNKSTEFDELHDMLGDITEEFDNLMSSLGGSDAHNINDVSIDDIDDIFSSSSLLEESAKIEK